MKKGLAAGQVLLFRNYFHINACVLVYGML